jgi:hypothetical protein
MLIGQIFTGPKMFTGLELFLGKLELFLGTLELFLSTLKLFLGTSE